jgi:hypothetical protein
MIEIEKVKKAVLDATANAWVAEKVGLLCQLENAIEDPNRKEDRSEPERIRAFILEMNENETYSSLAQYIGALAFQYPLLRTENQDVFMPSTHEGWLHIKPDKEPDLDQFSCPYCKTGKLGAVNHVKKGLKFQIVGCTSCKKGFTPHELIQIRSLARMKATPV